MSELKRGYKCSSRSADNSDVVWALWRYIIPPGYPTSYPPSKVHPIHANTNSKCTTPRERTDLMYRKRRMRTAVHQASVREHDTSISKENNLQAVVAGATFFSNPTAPRIVAVLSGQLPRKHAPLDFSANQVLFGVSVPPLVSNPLASTAAAGVV